MIVTYMKPRFRMKVAFFDYDWTLVKPINGVFPKNVDDWIYLRDNVKDIVVDYYKKGYMIVIVTNQSKEWKIDQIKNVMNDIGIPITALIAMNKEDYKPSINLFYEHIKKEIKKTDSFMCGDALGRKNDYSDSDLEFGKNIGIRVYSPEEIFPIIQKAHRFELSKKQEIIVMVGMPGSGKTTIAEHIIKENVNYIHINGDIYKTSKKMIKEANKYLDKSIIFDATNGTIEKRKDYIDFAKSKNIAINCMYKDTSMVDSMVQNDKREKPIPRIVYYVYNKQFVMPKLEEGFENIKMI